MSRWVWALRRVARQIWFRAALMSLFAVFIAGLAAFVAPYLPIESRGELGENAVGTLLEIMASSMLAVTTFSLTAMVSAYGSATQLGTPRATQLMINDPTSQNALSTFLGAFVFAIVGIIGLQTRIYGTDGQLVLFFGTILVLVFVVVTLLRWISHITSFGRMSDVMDRVEDAADRAMDDFVADPHLGGRPAEPVPAIARPVPARETGYVTHVDVPALGSIAEEHDLSLHVDALPGTLVHPQRPVVLAVGRVTDDVAIAIAGCFTVERHRTYDQDPRLGLIALSEIASRALSPAVNDPGTAIEVLSAMLRVLLRLSPDDDGAEVENGPRDGAGTRDGQSNARVYVARPEISEFLTDAMRPIIRDGCGAVEVMIRLDKTLKALHDALPQSRAVARELADRAAAAVERATTPEVSADFAREHRAVWHPTTGTMRA